jgi:hypothetical protein
MERKVYKIKEKEIKTNKKKAILFKNIMFNKKEIVLFSLSGIIKLKKQKYKFCYFSHFFKNASIKIDIETKRSK